MIFAPTQSRPLSVKEEVLAFEDCAFARSFRRGASQRAWERIAVTSKIRGSNRQTCCVLGRRANQGGTPLVQKVTEILDELLPHNRVLTVVYGETL